MMIQYKFLKNTAFADQPDLGAQIIDLYRENDWWGAVPEDVDLVRRIVTGSHCFLVAEGDGGKILGMGRAISDGVSDAYIQDVTVNIEERGTGIGSELIRRLTARLTDDGIQWIGLIAEKGSYTFYTRIGFQPMVDAIPMLWVAP
jgi:aralkylamine N-acetyltransferase